ncbi:Endonuclease/exonuclease/phosphatase [Schizophyllum fasciatum]
MKILTWNINGIRTIPQYHPWNGLKSHKDILDKLDADIICFQEMKSSRQNLPKDVAVPQDYTSFFSFPTKKAGYSGVAIYARDQYAPRKVEDHLCGLANATTSDPDRISPALSSYPMYCAPDEDPDAVPVDFKSLDAEGRTLIADFGLFVLVNVYCPNDGADTQARAQYKMDFHRALSARVHGLVEEEGREVIVVGDLNAVADVRDHCEGALMLRKIVDEARVEGEALSEAEAEERFYDAMPARRWLRDWLVERGGPLVDLCKRFWPGRKGMYTCWNTKISARASNYGTRIDFILVTPGLLPLIKHADIQPDVKGSDHCPVVVEFHDEVDVESIPPSVRSQIDLAPGTARVPLQTLMTPPAVAPRLAAKNWDEYSGKQRLLDGFFKGGSAKSKATKGPALRASKSASQTPGPQAPALESTFPSASAASQSGTELPVQAGGEAVPVLTDATLSTSSDTIALSQPSASTQSPQPPPSSSVPSTSTTKRKASAPAAPLKRQKTEKGGKANGKMDQGGASDKSGQTKLSAFFVKPKVDAEGRASDAKGKARSSSADAPEKDADYLYALELSREFGAEPGTLKMGGSFPAGRSQRTSPSSPGKSASSWQDVLAAPPAPRCYVHGEPAREFVVNKKGENKGRAFYVCSRPVGPGYDKGRTERRREDVDPQFKCDFFKWKSDVRKEFNSKRGKG